ncbi:putative 3'(2'),5'-bisphosphate nucleotidase, mitochondrial [Elaeis guineensis]|uniref:PAP-specific phosphatase, mitochondrial n=1 Tax=Elaeis guineensis var. tenera TaxID=51953 RepID=A0A6I9Q8Y5_ELAGV|nr:putative PAP-specific phosphatase, mitochondrial [Elaeis guineensis]
MTLLHPSSRLPVRRFGAPLPSPSSRALSPPALSLIRSCLPFPPEKARFHRELEAAVDVVERACRLCVDVKKSLLSSDGRILEKNDRTPVTIADFGVQALISLELKRLFPSIPLVAEEDSGFLRSNPVNAQSGGVHGGNFLVDSVLSAVADKTSSVDEPLTSDDVLEAIDRGGKHAVSFDAEPSTYWVLDPIDGTRGFLKGSDALYVVGLALVVKGEIAIGVMGCPNWKEDNLSTKKSDDNIRPGVIMIAHSGCGTWTKGFSDVMGNYKRIQDGWRRCFVDSCWLVHEACFCIPDSQTWDFMPLSVLFSSSVDYGDIRDDKQKVLLLPTCCGSLCKYLMVASGRASVFILRARAQTVIKVWDHAVGVICVHEAGGQVTDWNGSALDLAADQVDRRIIFPSGGVLVTNGALHKQLLEMISSNSSIA